MLGVEALGRTGSDRREDCCEFLVGVKGGGERTRGRFTPCWFVLWKACLMDFCDLTGSVFGSALTEG